MVKRIGDNKLLYVLIFIALLTITGCSNALDAGEEKVVETENPDAKEVLTSNSDADIFQFNDVIYQTDIDWVEEKSLTKDEQVGEIKTRNETDTNFENEMSNKLPVGAKIFTTKEEDEMFLVVESEGEIIKYYAIVEG